MYLIATHIPIRTDGLHHFTDISWQRDLILARDWLGSAYGGLRLIAPSLPLSSVDGQNLMEAPIGLDDGIDVIPSFDARGRARQFWIHDRYTWIRDVKRSLIGARVFHTSACDIFRPMAFIAHSIAVHNNIKTVFVGPDIDVHATQPQTPKGRIYCAVFDYWMRRTLQQSQLALLKEGLVYERYHRFGKNVKSFCHSMHSSADVVSIAVLEQRLSTLASGGTIRAVFAGRFVRRKGLHDAVAAIAIARRLGTPIELHLFGGGPEEESLRAQTITMGIRDAVIFHGVVEYSPSFIHALSEFDIFLFMPTEEDTPRALFDTMAAGLPLVGTSIPFLQTRVANDRHGILVNIGDKQGAAAQLWSLHQNPEKLRLLSRNARTAGVMHAVEQWYRRRSDWTHKIEEPYVTA